MLQMQKKSVEKYLNGFHQKKLRAMSTTTSIHLLTAMVNFVAVHWHQAML